MTPTPEGTKCNYEEWLDLNIISHVTGLDLNSGPNEGHPIPGVPLKLEVAFIMTLEGECNCGAAAAIPCENYTNTSPTNAQGNGGVNDMAKMKASAFQSRPAVGTCPPIEDAYCEGITGPIHSIALRSYYMDNSNPPCINLGTENLHGPACTDTAKRCTIAQVPNVWACALQDGLSEDGGADGKITQANVMSHFEEDILADICSFMYTIGVMDCSKGYSDGGDGGGGGGSQMKSIRDAAAVALNKVMAEIDGEMKRGTESGKFYDRMFAYLNANNLLGAPRRNPKGLTPRERFMEIKGSS